MKNFIIIACCCWANVLFAQDYFLDDFEDNALSTNWNFEHETYTPLEEEGVLKISYNRKESSWEWDQFSINMNFRNFKENPFIVFKMKSDVDFNLVLKPVNQSEASDWIEVRIPNDNQWHEYTVEMFNAPVEPIGNIYIYFNAGTTSIKNGNIAIDDFEIGKKISKLLNTQILEKAIQDAQNLHTSMVEGTAAGQNPGGDKAILQMAIESFQNQLNNIDSTSNQFSIDSLSYALYDLCISLEQKTISTLSIEAVDDKLVYSAKTLLQNLHQLKGPRFLYGMQDPTGYGATWAGSSQLIY